MKLVLVLPTDSALFIGPISPGGCFYKQGIPSRPLLGRVLQTKEAVVSQITLGRLVTNLVVKPDAAMA